jgi:HSP20 family molecular chaperone IbpA
MAKTHAQEIQKHEVHDLAEQPRPGRVFTPDVDIFEDDQAIKILADLPGVTPDGLTIDLRDDVLSLTGRVESITAEDESDVLGEYDTGTFFRQFTLSDVIDQSTIDAHLHEGVLRLVLPKAESARPRQITIRTS